MLRDANEWRGAPLHTILFVLSLTDMLTDML